VSRGDIAQRRAGAKGSQPRPRPAANLPALGGRRRWDLLAVLSRGAAATMLAAAAGLAGFLVHAVRQAGGGSADGAPHAGSGLWETIGPAVAGTLWFVLATAALALPIGIGTALYLEEYAWPKTPRVRVFQAAVANLAGVPSVVYGVAGLVLLVHGLSAGRNIFVGALALGALALPTVVATSAEAIRAVPNELRTAAYGLGATRWQVVRHQVLPAAAAPIATGTCAAVTRAAGEAAPLLVIGAASFATFAPAALGDPIVSLPTQIFVWAVRPQPEFAARAAGAAIALLAILLGLNLAVLVLRRRLRRAFP